MPTPPPLYRDLPTPEEMSRWDQAAHDMYGIPALLLMENAAQAAFEELKRCFPLSRESRILIFAGKGNNGGDGLALARILHDEGYTVMVYSTVSSETFPSPAREHAAMALSLGVPVELVHEWTAAATGRKVRGVPSAADGDGVSAYMPDVIVDALTGTGIRGNLRPLELSLVRGINAWREKAFIFSLDIPSGLSGLTGKAMPEAVRAHATVCFEAGKPGLFMPGASAYTGRLAVRRVGIPLELRRKRPPSWQLISPQKGAWAEPSPFSHKGSAGKVLVIGGSEGMAGAPLLAALGSLRAGAGLVHAALPAELEPAIRAGWPEILSHPIGKGRVWREEDGQGLLELMRSIMPDALVIGPGMGRTGAVEALLAAVLNETKRPPCIVDADALYFFALPEPGRARARSSRKRLPGLLGGRDILTPHPGEMARMLPNAFYQKHAADALHDDLPGRVKTVQEFRPQALEAFARVLPAVLVLKGAGSLVGGAGRPRALSPFAVASLGVGGSGDVLSGVCAALVASGMDSFDAACLGVHLHGRAGELLSQKAKRGHTARDIAASVPAAWEELCGA